jgi:hypothetical protein
MIWFEGEVSAGFELFYWCSFVSSIFYLNFSFTFCEMVFGTNLNIVPLNAKYHSA